MAANITSTQRIAIGLAAARSTVLAVGFKYAITASAECTIRQGGSTVDAALDTANNWFLGKGGSIEITPSGADDQYISVISGTAGGSLYIARLDRAS